MAKLTQKAIRASFLHLLAQYPLHQITVQMITEGCGLNRKTFYYHYADIPALLEEVVSERVHQLVAEYQGIASLEGCLDVLLKELLREKNVVLNICNSVSHDIVARSLMQICDALTATYVASAAATAGHRLAPHDAELVYGYYRSVCMGLVMDWLLHGMPEEAGGQIHRLCALRSGLTEQFLQRVADAERS